MGVRAAGLVAWCPMSAIVTSVIAVLGTLLGSTVTHAFQQRSAMRTELSSRQERLRQERLDVYGAYAGLLVEFRQAMLHHWFCEHEGQDAEAKSPCAGGRSNCVPALSTPCSGFS